MKQLVITLANGPGFRLQTLLWGLWFSSRFDRQLLYFCPQISRAEQAPQAMTPLPWIVKGGVELKEPGFIEICKQSASPLLSPAATERQLSRSDAQEVIRIRPDASWRPSPAQAEGMRESWTSRVATTTAAMKAAAVFWRQHSLDTKRTAIVHLDGSETETKTDYLLDWATHNINFITGRNWSCVFCLLSPYEKLMQSLKARFRDDWADIPLLYSLPEHRNLDAVTLAMLVEVCRESCAYIGSPVSALTPAISWIRGECDGGGCFDVPAAAAARLGIS
jgi:hypothetical protein